MELLKSKLESIVLKHLNQNDIHGLNHDMSQSKKLVNVKMVHGIKDEDILLIYDNTLFGSAKDGMIFTNRGIYWRQLLASPQHLDYHEIIESTAHKDIKTKSILVLDQEREIQVKDVYYKIICDLKIELVSSFIVYETYYKGALMSFENTLVDFEKNEKYKQIIEWLNKYEGLFLDEKDKSSKVRQIAFKAYLMGKDFAMAQNQLDYLEKEDKEFYRHAGLQLERAIKEEKYNELEKERLQALDNQDYQEAYIIFGQQRNLRIKDQAQLSKIELSMKESHYECLNKKRKEALKSGAYDKAYAILEDQKGLGIKTSIEINEMAYSMTLYQYDALEIDRLKQIEKDEYSLAFNLLEKQRALNVKQDNEIDKIKEAMESLKDQTLKQYHESLKVLVEKEDFIESEKLIQAIYTINPLYNLEREEILLQIYQYRLIEARQAIEEISDLSLKAELDNKEKINRKILYKEMRRAARNSNYNYFSFFPNIWQYKDEYNMTGLEYFALAGDLEGIELALDQVDLSFMPTNIFGHNFIDLICLSCDPNFGGLTMDPLEILKKIKDKVDLKQMQDRISFFETGQEGYFFSYKMSQAGKLSDLNKELTSQSYFNKIRIDIEKQASNDVDQVIRQLFADELEEISSYPVKDEFESSKAYKKRCQKFKQQYLERSDFIEEYKRQNQEMVEKINQLLQDEKTCFIFSLSAWIEWANKDLALLKFLESQEGLLELFDLYFPIKTPLIELGNYDADKELFFILVDSKVKEMEVPLRLARKFKEEFDPSSFLYHRVLEEGALCQYAAYHFEEEEFILVL